MSRWTWPRPGTSGSISSTSAARPSHFFFFQAEDGIRDLYVTGFRRVLFRSPILSDTVKVRELFSDGTYRRRAPGDRRSEEHTSELQSRREVVCRLLLEKKKKKKTNNPWFTYNKNNDKV